MASQTSYHLECAVNGNTEKQLVCLEASSGNAQVKFRNKGRKEFYLLKYMDKQNAVV